MLRSKSNVPQSWLERRLEEIAPQLARTVEDELLGQITAVAQSFVLPFEIRVSYSQQSIASIASKLGVSSADLLEDVKRDLQRGLSISSLQTLTGCVTELILEGARWLVTVRGPRHSAGKRSVCTLDGIHRTQEHNESKPRFPCRNVSFDVDSTEPSATLGELEQAYEHGRAKQAEPDHRLKRLDEQLQTHRQQREDTLAQIEAELSRPPPIERPRDPRQLLAAVKEQYAAFRVMTSLLEHRSNCEAVTVEGTIRNAGDRVEMLLTEKLPEGAIRTPSRIRLRHGELAALVPLTIHSIRNEGQGTVLELSQPQAPLKPGAGYSFRVTQFGMRPHQNAMEEFLREQNTERWPWHDLARLLSSPAELSLSFDAAARDSRLFFNTRLHPQQQEAVHRAIDTPHALCIQGPPGTGKTTVICEIVEQLVSAGERVLLVAPTHVAVDEVLQRIGARRGVRALRIAADESKVSNDEARQYLPTHMVNPLLRWFEQSDDTAAERWSSEQASLSNAIDLLNKLSDSRVEFETATDEADNASRALTQATRDWDLYQPIILSLMAAFEQDLRELAVKSDNSWQEISVFGIEFPLPVQIADQLSRLSRHFPLPIVTRITQRLCESVNRLRQNFVEMKSADTRQYIERAKKLLAELRRDMQTAAEEVSDSQSVLESATLQLRNTETACGTHPQLKTAPISAGATGPLIAQFKRRHQRLGAYGRLSQRFRSILKEADTGASGLRNDVFELANLFCCTSIGASGSPQLRERVFSTLIVDEASRVTDAEFMCSATKAQRWILVGDEKQLPPYVESKDEHFLHALSALHMAETTAKPLTEAVKQLGELWFEDEQLHRFRADSVLDLATAIQEAGTWKSTYRKVYEIAFAKLKESNDAPEQELLRSMRDFMVRSLFERVVEHCPNELKVQLIEQHRMIEPLARIVCDPIYGGRYVTPSADVLARNQVVPLTTATFPKPVTFLDTTHLREVAFETCNGSGFVNETEAELIVQACEALDHDLGVVHAPPVKVSILAFYKAQASLITEKLQNRKPTFANLTFAIIDSIDGIQGQESDVVFISFCRTADGPVKPQFGQWLQDLRRLNVACTRAHRALFFVGQKSLLGKLCSHEQAQAFYRHLLRLFDSYPEDMETISQFGGRRR